jgi:hypothetical protein
VPTESLSTDFQRRPVFVTRPVAVTSTRRARWKSSPSMTVACTHEKFSCGQEPSASGARGTATCGSACGTMVSCESSIRCPAAKPTTPSDFGVSTVATPGVCRGSQWSGEDFAGEGLGADDAFLLPVGSAGSDQSNSRVSDTTTSAWAGPAAGAAAELAAPGASANCTGRRSGSRGAEPNCVAFSVGPLRRIASITPSTGTGKTCGVPARTSPRRNMAAAAGRLAILPGCDATSK